MNIFGFEIKRKSEIEERDRISFSPKEDAESSIEVTDYGTGAAGGVVASFMDLSTVAQSETELINRYRGMAAQPEIATAIDHIINELVYLPANGDVVNIVPDDIEYSDKIKDSIKKEFYEILSLMDFSNNAYEIIRRWYIDGVLYYHVMIDPSRPQDGIKEIRYVDPRKIKKVRVYEEVPISNESNILVKRVKNEHFIYSETGFNTVTDNRGSFYGASVSNKYTSDQIVISKDSIVSASSGLMDVNNRFTLSHLDQAFRPLNSLRIEEDATVIYRVTRAPERRAFYIDVSGLPPSKAEGHVKKLMDSHNKKMQYNSQTGELVDDSRIMTMTDDYWLPRKDGNRGTEIVPLAGGANLGEMEDVLYFQKALYKALKIPVSRLEADAGSFLGRQSEISRDEANFGLFITRLRGRFSNIFDSIMERQLILKKIINANDWVKIKNDIRYDFLKNNFFDELKEMEIIRERISLLNESEPAIGKYLSREWAMKHILRFTDDEVKTMDNEIEIGKKKGFYDDFGGDGDPDEDIPSGLDDNDLEDTVDDEPDNEVTLKVSVDKARNKPENEKKLDIKNTTQNKETGK